MMTLLILPALLLAGAAAARRLYLSHATGAALVVLAYLAAAAATEPVSFPLGDFSIYAEDLLGAALIAIAALRMTILFRKPPLGWMLFFAATVTAFALGAAAYGVKPAGVEFRGYFYLSAAALYCASFPLGSSQLASLVSVWLGGAAALVGLAIFRWTATLLQLGIASSWADVGGGNPLRVLNASQTFYLAEALLMLLYLWRHTSKRWTVACLTAILAATIVLLQHRSVWVAAAIGCAAMARREGFLRKFAAIAVCVSILGITVAWILPERATRNNAVAESLGDSMREPFDSGKSTFGWRVSMWQAYLLEFLAAPAAQKVFGLGLGNPAIYSIEKTETRAAAHNYFIFTLNRAGLFGLAALVIAYIAVLRRLRGAGGSWDYLGMLSTLTICQLIYFTVYSPSYDQGLLAGAAFGIVLRRPNASA